MTIPRFAALAFATLTLALPACQRKEAPEVEEKHKIVLTSPKVKDVVVTQQYVAQICSQKHTEVRAIQDGYLEAIGVNEGQAVEEKQVLFQVMPVVYKARLDAEEAEVRVLQLKYENTKRLNEKMISGSPVVSAQDLAIAKAELEKAEAKATTARRELELTTVKASFAGIIDRMNQQQGSLVKKEDILTTLSDNSVMRVYFNVPEVRYLEYMAGHEPAPGGGKQQILDLGDAKLELMLVNGSKFNPNPKAAKADHSLAPKHDEKVGHTPAAKQEEFSLNSVIVEGEFNRETGNIQFRADFPNPNRLLRHGQTGSVIIHKPLKNAVVIPQRATFEILDKRYVFVVDAHGEVKQREFTVLYEMEDVFVVKGLAAEDKIVFDGVRQVKEGDKLEDAEFITPDEALAKLKHRAE